MGMGMLKGSSGQKRSHPEWYHCKGLVVIIHRCQIQNFDLEFGFEFKVLDLLIQRSFFAGRLRWKSFFVSCGENVFDEKFVQVLHKSFSKQFWETQNRPLNIKCLLTIFFGDRFVGKEVSLRTYKPSSQELGVGGFCESSSLES
jgi:hypothetical protein